MIAFLGAPESIFPDAIAIDAAAAVARSLGLGVKGMARAFAPVGVNKGAVDHGHGRTCIAKAGADAQVRTADLLITNK